MILHCRPPGRGNWNLIVIEIHGMADLYRMRPGMRFSLGDPALVLRIVKVLP